MLYGTTIVVELLHVDRQLILLLCYWSTISIKWHGHYASVRHRWRHSDVSRSSGN